MNCDCDITLLLHQLYRLLFHCFLVLSDIPSVILLDHFVISWEETHQETDETGPKAHQGALGPTEERKKQRQS